MPLRQGNRGPRPAERESTRHSSIFGGSVTGNSNIFGGMNIKHTWQIKFLLRLSRDE